MQAGALASGRLNDPAYEGGKFRDTSLFLAPVMLLLYGSISSLFAINLDQAPVQRHY